MKTSAQPIIELNQVSKTYFNHQHPYQVFTPIDLKIYPGQHIGLNGGNGAGKTTLLKIIAGITKPTTGRIFINGKVNALLELEAGFHPELTGRENIPLNALLAGIDPDEIELQTENIISYADIGEYIDRPFYTYSSGMKFRLAFSTAIHSKVDILLIDELFLSGDFEFQQKLLHLITSLQQSTKITTIVTSHVPVYLKLLADTYYHFSDHTLKKISSSYIDQLISQRGTFYQKLRTESGYKYEKSK